MRQYLRERPSHRQLRFASLGWSMAGGPGGRRLPRGMCVLLLVLGCLGDFDDGLFMFSLALVHSFFEYLERQSCFFVFLAKPLAVYPVPSSNDDDYAPSTKRLFCFAPMLDGTRLIL